jgi:hypothetical protein
MEFIARPEEIARLRRALSSEQPTLTVVYGRRRLGKTMLLNLALSGGDLYFVADRTEAAHQRHVLAAVVAQTYPDFARTPYPDWESLLPALNAYLAPRGALCLDEFPHLVEQSPELPALLQRLIDEKRLGYHLVLCGSAQNVMDGLCSAPSAPLYGRASLVLRVAPLGIATFRQALQLAPVEAVEEYAVWGGVPRYWTLRADCATLTDALWQHLFSPDGALYDEPLRLFQDDIKDPVKTSTLMSYIAAGAHRLSEIAARCGEPATNLSRPLKKLVELGYLEKEVPFGVDEKNAKKSLYKIADPLMAFYFRFVVPNRSFIELGRPDPLEVALDAHFSEFVGQQWERLCRHAVSGRVVDGVLYGRAARWWGSVLSEDRRPVEIELDVVAESLDKRTLLVGECKWTGLEDAERLSADLRRKAELLPFAVGRRIVTKLFLKTPPLHDDHSALYPEQILPLLS